MIFVKILKHQASPPDKADTTLPINSPAQPVRDNRTRNDEFLEYRREFKAGASIWTLAGIAEKSVGDSALILF